MSVHFQVSSLQSQLSAAQSHGSSLSAQLQQLSSDKSALSSANAILQQALMDKTLQAAKEADALRQQQAQQLAALRAEHQQQLDALAASAAAADDAHRQVRARPVCVLFAGQLWVGNFTAVLNAFAKEDLCHSTVGQLGCLEVEEL
jgi:hypothetical protein